MYVVTTCDMCGVVGQYINNTARQKSLSALSAANKKLKKVSVPSSPQFTDSQMIKGILELLGILVTHHGHEIPSHIQEMIRPPSVAPSSSSQPPREDVEAQQGENTQAFEGSQIDKGDGDGDEGRNIDVDAHGDSDEDDTHQGGFEREFEEEEEGQLEEAVIGEAVIPRREGKQAAVEEEEVYVPTEHDLREAVMGDLTDEEALHQAMHASLSEIHTGVQGTPLQIISDVISDINLSYPSPDQPSSSSAGIIPIQATPLTIIPPSLQAASPKLLMSHESSEEQEAPASEISTHQTAPALEPSPEHSVQVPEPTQADSTQPQEQPINPSVTQFLGGISPEVASENLKLLFPQILQAISKLHDSPSEPPKKQ